MAVDTAYLQVGEGMRLAIERQGIIERDAEFVVLEARRDIGVGFGVDVGIDAQRNGSLAPELPGDFIQAR